jgi:hypothetical protein
VAGDIESEEMSALSVTRHFVKKIAQLRQKIAQLEPQ